MPSAADIHGINKGNKGNSLEFIAHVILEKQSGNVPKGTKKKLQESYLSHVFCLRNLRDLRETLGFRLSTLMCYSPADYADHAEEYSMAVLFRREIHLESMCVLGFICDYLREILRFI